MQIPGILFQPGKFVWNICVFKKDFRTYLLVLFFFLYVEYNLVTKVFLLNLKGTEEEKRVFGTEKQKQVHNALEKLKSRHCFFGEAYCPDTCLLLRTGINNNRCILNRKMRYT